MHDEDRTVAAGEAVAHESPDGVLPGQWIIDHWT
jgi:hypothetical protein